ncbi:MAG: ABC transporter substrate-binding protein [Dehalococcoidia bacterium]|nr:ABC transporter substrate-binding protein [Dehalococcoidia bacterium]MCB9492375.1 ABC transporter substrate-binding protein [Dehalococcoidia bacterium]
MEGNYWTRRRVGRRAALRGAGLGVAGLAGAALIGCGGGDDGGDGGSGGSDTGANIGAQMTATSVATEAASGSTPVPADQVRITPGVYDGPVPPSAAELNPAVNAKRGGRVSLRYLDPPRMDLSRTLSCTIYHTLAYTSNKLTRGKVGASADPFRVELEPDLAESWEASDGGQKHTFNLRKGAKFHAKEPTNGREFTAEDVVKTVEMYSEGSQKDVFLPVTSMETPDDYTIVFNLDQPLADFPTTLAAWSYIYPRELVDNTDQRQEMAVGTGPFIQREWRRQEGTSFDANPDYWETDAAGNKLPYLDGVEALVQNDTNALRAGFSTDTYFDYAARDQDDLETLFQENQDTMVGSAFPRSRGANVNGFQFQMKNPTYQDDRVRQAMSLAFDPNEFDLASEGGDNQNPKGAYSNAPMPWPYLFDEYPTQEDNGRWYQWDPAEASKMMQAAGYTSDNPLTAEMPSFYYRTELSQLVVPAINQNLPEVDITFREVDNPTHVTMMSDRNFEEMVGFLWGPPGYAMDQWIFPFYHSAGGLNYGSINDADLDDLLVAQRTETDAAAQKDLWKQVWDRIHDKVYQMWFPESLMRASWHNYMLNFRHHGLMGSYTCYASDQARALWLDEGAPGR